jgi:hypothetical protein
LWDKFAFGGALEDRLAEACGALDGILDFCIRGIDRREAFVNQTTMAICSLAGGAGTGNRRRIPRFIEAKFVDCLPTEMNRCNDRGRHVGLEGPSTNGNA